MAVFDALVSTGLDVRDLRVPGYRGRGIDVRGTLWHHTASRRGSGDLPSLGTCLRGTAVTPGPLCQVLIGRAGTVAVITDGRANHAGKGSWPGITDGNGQLVGVEIENDGVGEPYPAGQIAVALTVGRALRARFGHRLDIGHKEWTRRKIDPSFDMDWFRAELDLHPAPDLEELLMSTSAFQLVGSDGHVRLFVPGQRSVSLGGLGGPHERLAHNAVAPLLGPAIPAQELDEFARRWDASVG